MVRTLSSGKVLINEGKSAKVSTVFEAAIVVFAIFLCVPVNSSLTQFFCADKINGTKDSIIRINFRICSVFVIQTYDKKSGLSR